MSSRLFSVRTVFLTLVALLTAACGTLASTIQTVRGSGKLATEPREVSGFTRIDLRGSGDVTVNIGDTESLTVTADDNLLDYLETTVQNGWLVINTHSGYSVSTTNTMTYVVTARSLSDVHLSGTGSFDVRGLTAPELKTLVRGSGDITISGDIERQIVEFSGAGSYNAEAVTCKDAAVNITGMGNVVLDVTDTLDVNISGAGMVAYAGSPRITQQVSGFGQIVQR